MCHRTLQRFIHDLVIAFLGIFTLVIAAPSVTAASLRLSSPAFIEGKAIPTEYTCSGQNVSPPLSWNGAPSGARSFALIVDDPDAPAGVWVHWLLYNVPASENVLVENIPPAETLPN